MLIELFEKDGCPIEPLYHVSVVLRQLTSGKQWNKEKIMTHISALCAKEGEEGDPSGLLLSKPDAFRFIYELNATEVGPSSHTWGSHIQEVLAAVSFEEKAEDGLRIHDPACGLGGFLLHALEKSCAADGSKLKLLLAQLPKITGCDSDPMSVNLAKVSFIRKVCDLAGMDLRAGSGEQPETHLYPEQQAHLAESPLVNSLIIETQSIPLLERVRELTEPNLIARYILEVAPNISCSDSIASVRGKSESYDLILCDPPFDGLLEDNSHDHHRFVDLFRQCVEAGGQAHFLLPDSFLRSGRDRIPRKRLLSQRLVSEILVMSGRKFKVGKMRISGDGNEVDVQAGKLMDSEENQRFSSG